MIKRQLREIKRLRKSLFGNLNHKLATVFKLYILLQLSTCWTLLRCGISTLCVLHSAICPNFLYILPRPSLNFIHQNEGKKNLLSLLFTLFFIASYMHHDHVFVCRFLSGCKTGSVGAAEKTNVLYPFQLPVSIFFSSFSSERIIFATIFAWFDILRSDCDVG